MDEVSLLRLGPVDDWVRTIAAHLGVEPTLGGTDDLDRALDDLAGRRLVLSCAVPGLNAVVRRLVRRDQADRVAIGWVADLDRDSRDLAERLGLPKRPTPAAELARGLDTRKVGLVRDDHGGVLLHRGRLSAWAGAKAFGAQSYHDDALVADGTIRRIEVTPHRSENGTLIVQVARPGRLRESVSRSTGRSIQTACDEGQSTVDGVPHPRPVRKWTWYADPHRHWLLRAPTLPG
ncbi:hypothetical protein BH20ACT5_BH20ACT5_03500 [soil metagenome]